MESFLKSRIFIFIIITLGSDLNEKVFSQTRISVSPQLAYESIQSYVIDNSGDPTFKSYNRHFSPSYGLNIQLDSKHQWMYFAGWNISTPVLGYKYRDTGPNLWWTTGSLSHRISLGLHKTIGTHRLFKLNSNSEIVKRAERIFGNRGQNSVSSRYLLLFRSKIISGTSYDLLRSIPGELNNNGTNASVFVGLGIQFFNLRKDHLQVNFIYSHGLKEVTEAQVTFFHNNDEYKASIGSRGSYFAFQFLYPLTLFRSQ